MAELPENERFELSAVYPCYVLGPSLVKEYKTGLVIVYNMTNKWPINGGIPNLAIGMVDVRDVALAHILCLTSDAAQGKRFIIAGGSMFFKEQAAELRKIFPKDQYDYDIASKDITYEETKKAADAGNPYAKKYLQRWGHLSVYNNTRSREVLGLQYRPASETLKDTVETLIKWGMLKDRRIRPKL